MSSPAQTSVIVLQRNLRALGYLYCGIDGCFGPQTERAVRALQYDLLNYAGTSSADDGTAPVAISSYNRGRVSQVTGSADPNLLACIADILADASYPKLPSSDDPVSANANALAAISELQLIAVPIPFLKAILSQESGGMHYRVPTGEDQDNFVVIGLDRNDQSTKDAITSRGYGIGQYTIFHHPPTSVEVAGVISDPVQNVNQTIDELKDKFENYVSGPEDTADDRIAEVGTVPLRRCRYSEKDAKYMADCKACLGACDPIQIQAGETPVFSGASMTYEKTQYHQGTYSNVPTRSQIPCDWPYAARRYNGSGPNSYDYQAEILVKVLND